GGKSYIVVGTLKRSEDGLQGLNPDDTVFVPFLTTKNREELMDEYAIPQAIGKAKNLDSVKLAMAQMQNTLNYYLENSSTYMIEDAGSRIEAATESARTMKMILISVAVIVFVVGGIGIMNVLFVTVKERTKEIGVLKALGSTKGDILLQFLLESLFIGVFSGVIGVALSVFALYFMGQTNIPVSPSCTGMLVAFGFSVLTSGLFGFYPAYKASGLKPVDALNYE
ncbi:MAG: FtsX-like permease family protein, partial [Oscillospiraceae bacterium]